MAVNQILILQWRQAGHTGLRLSQIISYEVELVQVEVHIVLGTAVIALDLPILISDVVDRVAYQLLIFVVIAQGCNFEGLDIRD